ncbi:flagellar motor switch protein FliM [Scatolibacter rhodanostii]|uniref:flagellar motor switch protein FliM n=1 Tax=Scatolibacter rhodanostii TaxID=2014781 RepID=UPI000C080E96|nr:flagellar motor switch protein FliM [Scatolibacter rhodanostii]
MAEILQQSQIDELLNRMRSGDVQNAEKSQEEKVKPYDFTSPKKFTKDQLKSLSNLYENYARILSSYFTRILRSVCEVTIAQIEEQRYSEFNNALPDNTLVGMIAFNPESANYDESTLMMELSTSLGFLLIDRLMGGSQSVYSPDRNYTDIEMSLIQVVLENVTRYMQEAWSNFFALKTSLRSIETNGRLLQAYSQQDIVVISTFEIVNENYKGTINICMPAENLEQIINSFSVKYAHSAANKVQDPEKEKVKKEMVLGYLKQSDLEVEAVLECSKMALNDVALLQKNDVIVLNKKIDMDIVVNIEKIPWYTARLGKVDEKKAIKLVDILVK